MKPINLKTALAKFVKQTIRVEASLVLISRPKDDKPRTVLLKNISINGQVVTDHMWIPYSKAWDKFSSKQRLQKFTFKTKVVIISSGPFPKYRFGKIVDLNLLCNYRNPNQKKEKVKDAIILPDTANLLPLLSASGKGSVTVRAIAYDIIDQAHKKLLILHDIITSCGIKVAKIPAAISVHDYSLLKNEIPCTIQIDLKIKGDLHKILPYQPVTVTSVKNIKIKNDLKDEIL